MSDTIIESPARAASDAGAASSGRTLLTWIRRRIAEIRKNRQIRRDLEELLALDDRLLADIGLHRCDVEYAARYGRRPADDR